MPVSFDQRRVEVGNSNNQVASSFLLCTYDICSTYRKLISVMCMARVIMFFQTIINLLLLKSYDKFHLFRVCNVLVTFLYLIIWYGCLVQAILNIIKG